MAVVRHLLTQRRNIIALGCAFVILAGGATYSYVQHQQEIALEKANALKAAQVYRKELGQVNTYYSQFTNLENEYSNLPNTTTKTMDEWDKYFDDLIERLQSVSSNSASAVFVNSKIVTLNKDIQASCTAFVSELNIDKAATDMSFQITNDTNQLKADQSTLNSERALYNEALTSGITLTNSYVVEYQGRVSSDNMKLSTDQQTLKNQQQQQNSANLETTLAEAAMNRAARVAGINL